MTFLLSVPTDAMTTTDAKIGFWCPGPEKWITAGHLVRVMNTAKANPDAVFKQGIISWWPTTGREIVRQFFDGVQDRINQAVPYHERHREGANSSYFPLTRLNMATNHTSSAFTPGPWTTEATADFGASVRVMDEGDCTVALCYQQPSDTWAAEANARLIAAAPELLQHLIGIVEMAHSVAANWENGDLAAAVRNVDRIATAAELAIAKAEGRCVDCTTGTMAGPIPGVLANGERCDSCERYTSDDDARAAIAKARGKAA